MIGLFRLTPFQDHGAPLEFDKKNHEAHLSKKQHESEIFDDFLAKI
jgi:hypothetical protein